MASSSHSRSAGNAIVDSRTALRRRSGGLAAGALFAFLTLGGPSATTKVHGVGNEDWFVTQGGDGFFSAIEPGNPDVVYSEAQHGALVRYDRKTGQQVDVQPQAGPGDAPIAPKRCRHCNWYPFAWHISG